ncbi:MAG: FKBP-type peptidyl-prolyl cis-trans isomerase [Nanoarchaeota archaeon]
MASDIVEKNDLSVISNVVQRNDFIEIKYTGYANGDIFDSNIEEDLKKLDKKAKPFKVVVIAGHETVIKGFDNALIGKELGKDYEITLTPKEGFGERKRELIKTIPLKSFSDQKFSPHPGMVLTLDNLMAKIIAVSGARVITDFNNPLSGKEIKYKFTVLRKLIEEKEKMEAFFEIYFRFMPEFEIKDKVIIKGKKEIEIFIKMFNNNFKEFFGKEMEFEEKKAEEKNVNTSHSAK